MPKEIDRHEVQALIGRGAQVLDVMSKGEYESSHIRGALHIPLGKLAEKGPALLDRERPIITYCYDSL